MLGYKDGKVAITDNISDILAGLNSIWSVNWISAWWQELFMVALVFILKITNWNFYWSCSGTFEDINVAQIQGQQCEN